ncbi:MAG: FIST C-terminal domain-containing protein, partial [Candidatus Adiutrix sp.]|nr:FIST C-terminal domain-containing protein [Candidatus Adiutrix sp.]
LTQDGLDRDEEEAGLELGRKLAALSLTDTSPVMLFYDAVNRSQGDLRLIMATPFLKGLERGLGFMPALVGAGLMADYACSPYWQWTGHDLGQHSALALIFSGNIRLDSIIMHGCHPGTGYFTVTKADRQVILEINGQPALAFLDRLLGRFIRTEDYPFFLILGVNKEDKWAPFKEESYASRLCLGLDRERGGLVMFEPDMVEGTEFQVMYRSLDLDYIPPKVGSLFDGLGGRRPLFATYIDCAGRAAGHAGLDIEDAVIIQREIAGRVPLLGIYTGVEIAPVKGRSRSLDWTGVLTLFSEAP